jgi:hypothetical protein
MQQCIVGSNPTSSAQNIYFSCPQLDIHRLVILASTMQPTLYPDINELLDNLHSRQQAILGDKLIGLYLYGSLAWGDFDYEISDIDLLAAIATELDPKEFTALNQMHDDIASHYQKWSGKIEVQYFSLLGLKTFKSQSSNMGNISPGEPFHIIKAGKEWLMNWFFVQDYGVTLFGPPPQSLIDPISKEEFVQAVRDHAAYWRGYASLTNDRLGRQAYVILTLCRAFYASKNGTQVSKKQAALWAEKQLPEWSTPIHNALLWRTDPQNNIVPAISPETAKLVNFLIDQIRA